MRGSFAAKLSNRITQLFGRTNRGRNDYSIIFVTDKRFVDWILTPRNVALLPDLLQKQVLLGGSLVKQFGIKDLGSLGGLVQQVVSRDAGWLRYYSDSIAGLKIGEEQASQAVANDKILTTAALAEADFAAFMWDGNPARAREALGAVVDKVVVADRRLAGWYNIQIGHTYELQADREAAAKQYAQALLRLNVVLALPQPETAQSISKDYKPKNLFHVRLLEIFVNDKRVQNDNIDRYKRLISPLFDSSATAGDHEEALRMFGEFLGFSASRPEQDDDNESTLDVLWLSESAKNAILIEAKTKKDAKGSVNKGEVGQAFNHLQATKEKYPGYKLLGLILVADCESCTKESSPSGEMWVGRITLFRQLFDELMQTLLALQRLPPMDRYAQIGEVALAAEWQSEAVFEKLRGKRLTDLKQT